MLLFTSERPAPPACVRFTFSLIYANGLFDDKYLNQASVVNSTAAMLLSQLFVTIRVLLA
jgi:hypothetical protein